MAQPSSGSENKLDESRHKLQGKHGVTYPFPGFIVNNTNNVEEHTPITKITCGSALSSANSAKSSAESSSTATTKTPPVEPSVSPEIQSSLYRSVHVSGAAPSTCYGAGHVISGLTDKRKCKARGILSVGPKNSLDIPEDDILCDSNGKNGQDVFTKSRPSVIPFPVEALISWHLSPSYVNDDADEEKSVLREGDSSSEVHQFCKIAEYSPCGSPCGVFRTPEVQGLVESSSDTEEKKFSSTSGDAPQDTPVISLEERISSFDFDRESSPFSADSLSSGNIMQTPNSDSSLEKDASFSWLKEGVQPKHQFESELDHVTDALQHESLSPNGNSSPWEPPG
nr:hypothetical protein [Tanacetum cinerariifolium]